MTPVLPTWWPVVQAFRDEVSLAVTATNAVLEFPWGRASVDRPEPGLLVALNVLFAGGARHETLLQEVFETDGAIGAAVLLYYLNQWDRLGLLRYTVVDGDVTLATVVPMVGGVEFASIDRSDQQRFRLSRFAYLRRDQDELVLESPRARSRTIVHEGLGVGLVAQLAQPTSCPELCSELMPPHDGAAMAFLGVLVGARLVAAVGADSAVDDEQRGELGQWSFHDFLFHRRTRVGSHDRSIGADFPFLGRAAPLPAIRSPASREMLDLKVPDLSQLERVDQPFYRVFEERRSTRDYARDQPISVGQLGEFLYRVARVRAVTAEAPEENRPYETSNRPYPSGGAAYDLELYLVVGSCVDLGRGLYHYDPLGHRLGRLDTSAVDVDALLLDAARSMGVLSEPQVLVILASRFQRLSWKYSGIAYATTLKNVGVLFQSMHLVATAMGLGACCLGAGNSALFANAAGTEEAVESSVGEIVLGVAERA